MVSDLTHPHIANQVAALMCRVTEDVLWAESRDWFIARHGRVNFSTRVGAGKATHCKNTNGRRNFEVTYGMGMIQSKADPNQAKSWTTGKEIIKRGYYNGELTMENLLAQTVCHEFAHAVQVINGWRHYGEVHNADFYRVLDRMHQGGAAARVREELTQKVAQAQISLGFNSPLNTPPVLRVHQRARVVSRGGEVITGEIVSVRRTTVLLRADRESGGKTWKVSMHMLQCI